MEFASVERIFDLKFHFHLRCIPLLGGANLRKAGEVIAKRDDFERVIFPLHLLQKGMVIEPGEEIRNLRRLENVGIFFYVGSHCLAPLFERPLSTSREKSFL